MTSNLEYFRTTAGKLKCISILLNTIVLALIAVGFFGSKYTLRRDDVKLQIGDNEEVAIWGLIYLLAGAAVVLLCSVVNLLTYLFSREIYYNRRTAIVDFVYHCLAFLILSTSGGLAIVNAVQIFDINCTTENKCQQFEVIFSAGAMSLASSIFFGAIGAVVLTNRKDVERDGLLADD